MKIQWNGFLEKAVDEYPREACAFLFSRRPYGSDEEWFVFPVDNVAEAPEEMWIPDKKQMLRAKSIAIKRGLVKIGNIHTHIYPKGIPFSEETLQKLLKPSTKGTSAIPGMSDLRFARKFNDIVRGIVAVGEDAIYGIKFHDKFGNNIPITVVSEEIT